MSFFSRSDARAIARYGMNSVARGECVTLELTIQGPRVPEGAGKWRQTETADCFPLTGTQANVCFNQTFDGGLKISIDTKTKILDAAEELFARNGLGGTSAREASPPPRGVNVASINYHFGSRDKLIEAVFHRRLGPLNRERLRLLDLAERDASGEPSLEKVVGAMVYPALRLSEEAGSAVMGIMGRVHSEPPVFIASLFRELFGEVMERFIPAFERCLPHLPWECAPGTLALPWWDRWLS